MSKPENQKALTLKNLLYYTVSSASKYSYLLNYISNTTRTATTTVELYNWRNCKIFSVALGAYRNYFLKTYDSISAQENHMAILYRLLSHGMFMLIEHSTYTYLGYFADIITDNVYILISNPQDPVTIAKVMISQATRLRPEPKKYQDLKNTKGLLGLSSLLNHNNNFKNNNNNNNNNNQSKKRNSNFKFIDPKNCKFCHGGTCLNKYHKALLQARKA